MSSGILVTMSLPIADRRTSMAFYRDGLGLEAIGESAEDGVSEPLQFAPSDGVGLMLVSTGGFGWVIGDHDAAARGHSECILSLSAEADEGDDDIVERAVQAGAQILAEPAQQPWGYAGAFTDPAGHVWMVTSEVP